MSRVSITQCCPSRVILCVPQDDVEKRILVVNVGKKCFLDQGDVCLNVDC